MDFKEKLKILKDKTGAALIDCKKALDHESFDLDKAVTYLKNQNKINQKNMQSRKTQEGSIFFKIVKEVEAAIIFILNCETDFVARNEEFQKAGIEILKILETWILKENLKDCISQLPKLESINELLNHYMQKLGEKIEIQKDFIIKAKNNQYISQYIHSGGQLGVICLYSISKIESFENLEFLNEFEKLAKDIGMQIVSMNPQYITTDKIDPEFLLQEEERIKKELNEGASKPEAIIKQIIQGKMNQIFQEIVLLKQSFIKDPKISIEQLMQQFEKQHSIKISMDQFIHLKVGKEAVISVV